MRGPTALAVLLMLAAPQAHAGLSLGSGVDISAAARGTAQQHVGGEAAPGRDRRARIVAEHAQEALIAAQLRGAKGVVHLAHGRGGIGVADYRGSFLLSPRVSAKTTTVFATTSLEAQLRARGPAGLEAVGSFGFDWWHRQLSARQQEDYQIVSLRMSIERGEKGARGWSGGAGLQVPLVVREDAHFTDLGFDRNPTLEPARRTGLFGHLGYRFAPHFSGVGSLDSFHLGESGRVSLRTRGGSSALAFQPATDLLMLGVRMEYSR